MSVLLPAEQCIQINGRDFESIFKPYQGIFYFSNLEFIRLRLHVLSRSPSVFFVLFFLVCFVFNLANTYSLLKTQLILESLPFPQTAPTPNLNSASFLCAPFVISFVTALITLYIKVYYQSNILPSYMHGLPQQEEPGHIYLRLILAQHRAWL